MDPVLRGLQIAGVSLQPVHELRFEVKKTQLEPAKVKLLQQKDQFAEICGAEMAPGTTYDYAPGTTGSVFTWHGCNIELQGLGEDDLYTAEAPEMMKYGRAHSVLEKKRVAAREEADGAGMGPRVLVCGGANAGKATVARILCNYAVRTGWQVTYADLDYDINTISLPGTIAAVPIDMPVPTEEGYSVFPPLAYFYGSSAVEEPNVELYRQLVSSLASNVLERQKTNEKARLGGVIVKAMTTTSIPDMVHIIKEFDIDVVLVVGNDKLTAQLGVRSTLEALQGHRPEVVPLPMSGGCVVKTEAKRELLRSRSVAVYFNGWPHMRLHPHRYYVSDTSKMNFVKIGGSFSSIPLEGLLPIGEKSTLSATDVIPVQPSRELEHSVLAISQAATLQEVCGSPVLGFAKVLTVSEDGNTAELLLPVPVTVLEPNIFIIGGLKYIE